MVYNVIFMLVVLAAIIGIAWYISRQRHRLERERTVLLLQQEALRDQSAQLRETVNRCRGYREEISQMMAASGLFGEEKGQAEDTSTETAAAEKEDVPEPRTYCENMIIQAVLQHKEIECRRKKIPLMMHLEDIDAVKADDIDLVGIFYNLLDNAIEANMRLPDPGDRYIRVSSFIEEKQWVLSMENRSLPPDEMTMRKGTWKRDPERHGIGQTILRDLVRENRGRIRATQTEDSYQVKIWMPIRRKAV